MTLRFRLLELREWEPGERVKLLVEMEHGKFILDVYVEPMPFEEEHSEVPGFDFMADDVPPGTDPEYIAAGIEAYLEETWAKRHTSTNSTSS